MPDGLTIPAEPRPGDAQHCTGCTACCRWPGEVFFAISDLAGVAAHLGLDERACADTFFDMSADRYRLKTKATSDGRCIFISETGCRVYPHRPRQCRTFPYQWQRPEQDYMAQCALYRAIRAREQTA